MTAFELVLAQKRGQNVFKRQISQLGRQRLVPMLIWI